MEELSARVADQRPFLRGAVLILDLMAATGLLVIVLTTILHAPSPEELAKMDPEAGVLPYLTTIILVPIALLFAIAAVGHWRRYAWRWTVQWVPTILAGILAAIYASVLVF